MADPLLDLLGVGAPAAAPQATPGAGVDPLLALVQPSGSPGPAAPAAPAYEPSMGDKVSQGALNFLSGAVRGAGSVGATLVAPYDIAKDAINGKGLSLDSNRQRRSDMDSALTSLVGAEPDSLAYGAGKLGTEVAGTSGVGGALASALSKIPQVVRAAPALIDAVRSGGMTAGGAGLATRTAGGAITGAASTALVNPDDAGTGALIGGAVPGVVQGVAAAGGKLAASQGAKLAQQLTEYGRKAPFIKSLQDSLEAGYVIPPATVNPTFTNKTLESVSGKIATQQVASVKNAEVTDDLVRKALTLPDDSPLTVGTLEGLRKTAGKAYADVGSLSPQAASDLEALKVARNESQGWFKAYNRSASPIDLQKAKDARDTATQLETALENHAQQANRPDLIPSLRDARKLIAQTYTVQRALNPATGTVDAKVLARMLQKGDPLSGGLDTVAQFASAFPTVAKRPEQIGSPDAHNMKAIASMLASIGGSATAGPVGALAGLLPFLAPPTARAVMFSKALQNGLVPQAPVAGKAARIAALLQNQSALGQVGRLAPVIGAASTGP